MMRYLGSSRGSHRSRYRGDDGRLNGLKTISLFGPSAHLFSLTLPPRASALPPLRRYRTSSGRIFSVSVDPISSFSRASLRCRFTRVGEE